MKINDFINTIQSKIGCGYVYGGQSDKPLTKDALQKLVKMFGKKYYYFTKYSAEKWLGNEYYDCSGLVVYTLQKLGIIPKAADYTAEGIYRNLCVPIQKADLRLGDLCFVNTSTGINHVGVYTGNGKVTHARGTSYGVVETGLLSCFNTFGRLKAFKDEPIDDLADALKYITEKSGIDYNTCYNTAKSVKNLDLWFIKIAKAWKEGK